MLPLSNQEQPVEAPRVSREGPQPLPPSRLPLLHLKVEMAVIPEQHKEPCYGFHVIGDLRVSEVGVLGTKRIVEKEAKNAPG